MLEPIQSTIAPEVSNEQLILLAKTKYGLEVGEVKNVAGYDDKNYHFVNVKSIGTNSYLSHLNSLGYIFKITNPVDAKAEGLVDGQNALLLHLRKKEIPCPDVIQQIDGNYSNWETFEGVNLPFRLFTFLPGVLTAKSGYTTKLMYQIGQLLARFHIATEDFHHPAYDREVTINWSMLNVDRVLDLMYIFAEKETKYLLSAPICSFRNEVLSKLTNFNSGLIHADLNENNLLVIPASEPGENKISALLDFGDCHRAPLILDISIAILYFTLDDNILPKWEAGGHILAGYLSLKSIPKYEMSFIRSIMAARMSMSLTYGYYASLQLPEDRKAYVLITQKKGWHMIKDLLEISDNELLEIYENVIEKYN